tara:strand:+ start:631 stop:1503 length:873 start_codon:yes stop_codon:yes gene_type:complete
MDSCYAIAFYLGDRRRKFPPYEVDRLCYLKKQIETLTVNKHSLNKIYFIFSVEEGHYDLLNKALNIIPKNIQGAGVEIIVRKNAGFSYGAWSDLMDKTNHDYYIFNEDDYFFIEDGWDSYMINSFKEKPNCGGFGIFINVIHGEENGKEHFGHSCFCTSKEIIQDIKTNYNGFTYPQNSNYGDNQNNQATFTYSLIKAGYRLYDIRDDYDLFFAMTDAGGTETGLKIMKILNCKGYFGGHREEKHLMIPDIIAFGGGYEWYLPNDGRFRNEERFRSEYPHPNPEVKLTQI